MDARIPDNRILLSTRLVAAGVVPVLVLAWIILFFFPGQTGERFVWEIAPPMTAVYMGAGYLGGAWLFVQTALGRGWQRVAPGFPAVTAFTAGMLLATVLHWERFDKGHFPFQIWLFLYLVTPVLIPLLWWRNRKANGFRRWDAPPAVPPAAGWVLRLLGGALLLFAIAGFARPDWLAGIWVWRLTPLTARILSGWFALLGVGGLVISWEKSWSAWQTGIQSIGLWHALVLVGALFHQGDFTRGLLNWYLASVLAMLLGLAGLYLWMSLRRAAA